MSLSKADAGFLARRRQLIGAWPAVGGLLLAAVTGLGLYLWFRVPLLGNPLHTLDRLDDGGIAETTLLLSAVLLPLVVLMLIGLSLALIIIVYRAFAHERRYIRIIDRLRRVERNRTTDR